MAPEVEFYLVNKNTDPDYELMPPKGRSGRREVARLSYSIDAVAEFEDFVEDMYDFADQQQLDVDTLIHENGAAQLEINFNHGDRWRWQTRFCFQTNGARDGAALQHVATLWPSPCNASLAPRSISIKASSTWRR